MQRALSQGSARAARRLALIYRNRELGEPKSQAKAMGYAYRGSADQAFDWLDRTSGNSWRIVAPKSGE